MKIMKMNGCTENYEGITYDWVCGEVSYSLVYDQDGDLYGLEVQDLKEKILDKIVYEPWDFDFPYTLDEYNESEN